MLLYLAYFSAIESDRILPSSSSVLNYVWKAEGILQSDLPYSKAPVTLAAEWHNVIVSWVI